MTKSLLTFHPGRSGSIATPIASGLACDCVACVVLLCCRSDAMPVPGLNSKGAGVFLLGLLEP